MVTVITKLRMYTFLWGHFARHSGPFRINIYFKHSMSIFCYLNKHAILSIETKTAAKF